MKQLGKTSRASLKSVATSSGMSGPASALVEESTNEAIAPSVRTPSHVYLKATANFW